MPKSCLTASLDSWGNCRSGILTWTSNVNLGGDTERNNPNSSPFSSLRLWLREGVKSEERDAEPQGKLGKIHVWDGQRFKPFSEGIA